MLCQQHELGHAFMTRKLGKSLQLCVVPGNTNSSFVSETLTNVLRDYKSSGGEVGGIVLWPLGGFALCGPTNQGASGDLKVALAGPVTHIPMTGLWVGVLAAVNHGGLSNFSFRLYLDDLKNGGVVGFVSALASQSIFLNIVLFAFNLFVPAYPLDGGRCLAAVLIMCGMDVVKAAIVTSVTGMSIAALIVAWGVIEFIRKNPSGIFMALIGLWIFSTSYSLCRLAKNHNLSGHPIFGRPCYQQNNATTASRPVDVAATAPASDLNTQEEEPGFPGM